MYRILIIICSSFILGFSGCISQNTQISKNKIVIQEKNTEQIKEQEKDAKKITTQEKEQLEKLIKNYFELARNGKVKKLKKLVALTPESYLDFKDKKSEDVSKNEEIENENDNSAKAKQESPSIQPYIQGEFDFMIDRLPKVIQKRNLHFGKITDFWIKQSEGRIRINIDGVSSISTISSLDFYVVKIDETWKLFRSTFASYGQQDNETYPY